MQPRTTSPWLLLHSAPATAAYNMAMDEALLQSAAEFGKPVLRFYSWSEPAASFGYFQKFAEIERITLLRPLVRRPTGGGLVPHASDWTYSIAVPPTASWHALKAVESYQRVHEWIRAAFLKMDVAAELAKCCQKAAPGQCFVGHEKFDVLWRGRKIAGAAQRRTRDGLLIQGSVQPPPIKISRADWEQAMCDAAQLEPGIAWENFETNDAFNQRIAELVANTYSVREYNQRR